MIEVPGLAHTEYLSHVKNAFGEGSVEPDLLGGPRKLSYIQRLTTGYSTLFVRWHDQKGPCKSFKCRQGIR